LSSVGRIVRQVKALLGLVMSVQVIAGCAVKAHDDDFVAGLPATGRRREDRRDRWQGSVGQRAGPMNFPSAIGLTCESEK
jgi:hypothetical protein